MKWVNHKITTFSVVLLLTQDFAASVIAAAGSIIPDALEGHSYNNKWKKRHRTVTHWFLGYFLIAFALWFFIKTSVGINVLSIGFYKFISAFTILNSKTLVFILAYGCFYLCVGALLHILEDSLGGAVPMIHPTRKTFALRIMRTGSFGEYLLSFGILIFSLLYIKKL